MKSSIDTIILLNLLNEESKSLLEQAKKYRAEMNAHDDVEIRKVYEHTIIFLLEHSKRLSNAAIGIANLE